MMTSTLATLFALVAMSSALAQDAPSPAPAAPEQGPPAAVEAPRGGNRGPRMGGDRGPRMGGNRGPGMGGDRGPRGGRMGMGMGGMGDASDFQIRMFTRMITRPQMAQELGISEELAEEIRKAFEDFDVKIEALQAEQEKAQAAQTELLKADPIDEEALLKALDAVWTARQGVAKLQMQKVLLVFGKLNPEQAAKAREFLTQPRMPQRFGGPQGGPQGPMPQPPQMPQIPPPAALQ